MASPYRSSNGRSRRPFLFQRMFRGTSVPSLWGESTMHKSDKRDGVRVPCEFEARIEPEAGPALRAVVRNISTRGARLEGVDVVAVPEQFDLLITRDRGATERRRARRVWGLDGAMGVNFIDGVGA